MHIVWQMPGYPILQLLCAAADKLGLLSGAPARRRGQQLLRPNDDHFFLLFFIHLTPAAGSQRSQLPLTESTHREGVYQKRLWD